MVSGGFFFGVEFCLYESQALLTKGNQLAGFFYLGSQLIHGYLFVFYIFYNGLYSGVGIIKSQLRLHNLFFTRQDP